MITSGTTKEMIFERKEARGNRQGRVSCIPITSITVVAKKVLTAVKANPANRMLSRTSPLRQA